MPSTFSVSYIFIANTKARSAQVNQNFTDVLTILQSHHHDPNLYTGASPITNSGIADNAQIRDTQLKYPITLSGLISPSALTVVPPDHGGLGLAGYATGDMVYATGALTFGRIPIGSQVGQLLKLNASLEPRWATVIGNRFGGDGSDGPLIVASGVVTIDLGGLQVCIKNYSVISITGTGKVNFTNPHDDGTLIYLRSASDITLTSSQTPMIDASGMGGLGGDGGAGGYNGHDTGFVGSNGNMNSDILDALNHYGFGGPTSSTAAAGAAITRAGGIYNLYSLSVERITTNRNMFLVPGCGGGGGQGGNYGGGTTGSNGAAGGNGGRGGGSLIMECAGDFVFSTTGGISVAGLDGDVGGTASQGSGGSSDGSGGGGGGGGGGSAGLFLCLANNIITNTGTVTVSGGQGGVGGNGGAATGNPSCTPGINRKGGNSGGGAGLYNAGTGGGTGANGGSDNNCAGGTGADGGDGSDGFALIATNTMF